MIRALDHVQIVAPRPEELRARLAALLGAATPLLRVEQGVTEPLAGRLRTRGPTHFCIQHRDIEFLTAALAEGGWQAIAAPTDLGGAIRYQYAEDGDGLIVEAESLPDGNEAAPRLAHVALATADRDRLCDWYAGLLGTTLRRSARLGPNAKIDQVSGMTDAVVSGAWLPAGPMEIEFWTYHNPPVVAGPPGPLRALVFASDDIRADAARHGLALTGKGAEGRDPDGNVVMLVAA